MKNGFGNPENTIPAIQTPGGTLSQIMERYVAFLLSLTRMVLSGNKSMLWFKFVFFLILRFYPFVKLGHVLVSLEVKVMFCLLL